MPPTCGCQIQRADNVCPVTRVCVLFGVVDPHVAGRIDHSPWFNPANDRIDRGGIGNIDLTTSDQAIRKTALQRKPPKCTAQCSGRADDQHRPRIAGWAGQWRGDRHAGQAVGTVPPGGAGEGRMIPIVSRDRLETSAASAVGLGV